MNDALEEIAARFTMLEFALEIIYANWLQGLPSENSEAFKKDLIEKAKRVYGGALESDPTQIERTQRIVRLSNEMMERFVDKVAWREAEFRNQ